MIVRGHTMVWYSQAGSLQGANQSTLNTYIKNALLKWRDKTAYWDVVNEALADNNAGTRRGQWPHTLDKDANNDGDYFDDGDTDYIRNSFKTARQVVKDNGLKVKLCINDYDIEGLTVKGGAKNKKADAMYEIVKKYSQEPYKYIDCVGFQSHFNDNPNSIISNDLENNIRRFAELGVEVQLTELDIDDDLSNNDIGQGQAANYRKVVRACLNVPKCTGITVWGIADGESWRSSERGLLFTGGSGNYTKKAAYTAVLDELNKGRPQVTTPATNP
jgi:endo-1,4-beta-xylanase